MRNGAFLRQQLRYTLLTVALLVASAAHGQEQETDTNRALFRAIDARLNHMTDVALFKMQNQIPVEDLQRERIVLENSMELAAAQGLDAQSMEQFFIAQITAAKAIQYRYQAEFASLRLPNRSVDLSTEIRPALDRLGVEIVGLFAELLQQTESLSENYREAFEAQLQSQYLTNADKDALYAAMRQVRIAQ